MISNTIRAVITHFADFCNIVTPLRTFYQHMDVISFYPMLRIDAILKDVKYTMVNIDLITMIIGGVLNERK